MSCREIESWETGDGAGLEPAAMSPAEVEAAYDLLAGEGVDLEATKEEFLAMPPLVQSRVITANFRLLEPSTTLLEAGSVEDAAKTPVPEHLGHLVLPPMRVREPDEGYWDQHVGA